MAHRTNSAPDSRASQHGKSLGAIEIDPFIHVFAYGSNMCTRRIRARAASATPRTTGYVTHRRLAFHKRGQDGSAKADALFTGCDRDSVWGVVFAVKQEEKRALDDHEVGYDARDVAVISQGEVVRALIYVARESVVDPSLAPFSWYHRLVVHGAREHRLPDHYVERLHAVESLTDPDVERHDHHANLIHADAARAARSG